MAHRKLDRVQQTTTWGGTGGLVLNGAPPERMRSFASVMSDGDTCWVLIEHQTANEFEISFATYSAGALSRSFAAGSVSSTGNLVNFSAGTKTVSLIAPAGATPIVDGGGNMYVAGALSVTGAIAKSNLVESAGGASSLRIYDNNAGLVNGLGTSASRFDLRSIDNFSFYSGSTPTEITRLGPTGLWVQGDAVYLLRLDRRNPDNGKSGIGFQRMGVNKYEMGIDYYSDAGQTFYLYEHGVGVLRLLINSSGHFLPGGDNVQNWGSGSLRIGTYFGASGAINTSDATDKDNISPLTDAEIRVGRRLRSLPKRYQFKDAIAEKGVEAARIHVGYIAQDVVAAFEAEGLNAFKYGCVGSDLLETTETYDELVWREKTEPYDVDETYIDIVDGVPMRQTRTVPRTRPVGTYQSVRDESGAVILVPTDAKDADGNPIMAPLRHFVPEMERVAEPRTRTVPLLGDDGQQRRRLNVRPDELDAFIVAALAADIAQLQQPA